MAVDMNSGSSLNAGPTDSDDPAMIHAETRTAEDEHDALSPTDGYFRAMPPQPNDEYVPDPEQENTPAAKEIEAREAQERRTREREARQAASQSVPVSRRRDASPAASSIVSASSAGSAETTAPQDSEGTRWTRRRAQRSALPSYDDAMAERPYQGHQVVDSDQRTYRTMSEGNDNAPGPSLAEAVHSSPDIESQPLLQSRYQSGGDGDDDREWLRHKERTLRAWWKRQTRRQLARKLVILLGFACAIALVAPFIQLAKEISDTDHHHIEPGRPSRPGNGTTPTPVQPQPEPVPEPAPTSIIDPNPTTTPEPINPDDPDDLTRGRFEADALSFCKNHAIRDSRNTLHWNFPDPGKVELKQTSTAAFALHALLRTSVDFGGGSPENAGIIHDDMSNQYSSDEGHKIRHRGQVIIERKKRGRGVSIQLGAYYSDKALSHQTGFAADGTSILYQVPQTAYGDFEQDSDLCVYSFAVIQVQPGYNLSRLAVAAESMSIDVKDTFDVGPKSGRLELTSTIGAVRFPEPQADISAIKVRDIYIETAAGSITGTFPLLDNLKLVAKAGQIDISIDPREADPRVVKPAKLDIETTAGEVIADVPRLPQAPDKRRRHWPPFRDYQTSIKTVVGNMDLRLLHGTDTVIESTAGRISALLLPCDDPSTNSSITIQARSSLINLDIANSLYLSGAVLNNLHTKVSTTVGSQSVGLPLKWEGRLSGSAVAGSYNIPLTDFVADRAGGIPGTPLLYSIKGHRGNGDSRVESSSISGAIEWRDAQVSPEHYGQDST